MRSLLFVWHIIAHTSWTISLGGSLRTFEIPLCVGRKCWAPRRLFPLLAEWLRCMRLLHMKVGMLAHRHTLCSTSLQHSSCIAACFSTHDMATTCVWLYVITCMHTCTFLSLMANRISKAVLIPSQSFAGDENGMKHLQWFMP